MKNMFKSEWTVNGQTNNFVVNKGIKVVIAEGKSGESTKVLVVNVLRIG